MTTHRPEVADILRAHGDAYRARHPVSPAQAAVMRRLAACRTTALGGHVDRCAACGYARNAYNSCRDRHCPKCRGVRRAVWLEERLDRLLPVPYFHVVFTIPDALNRLALRNQEVVYNLLFAAASQTLLTLAKDPERFGAQVGFTAVLHTWGQNLLFHPHLHCVVTGGGLSDDGGRWVAAREGYLLPVKVMGRLFRGKFLAGLKAAHRAGQLRPDEAEPAFDALAAPLYRRDWVVYAKAPFGGAEQVFRYLGRYTHRVAISNSRMLSLDGGRVGFAYKDYADGHKTKVMHVSAEEFIRRFLLHVLPKRFVRIRHYGLLAGRNVPTKLAACRKLLADRKSAAPEPKPAAAWLDLVRLDAERANPLCPACGGPLTREAVAPATKAPFPGLSVSTVAAPIRIDSS